MRRDTFAEALGRFNAAVPFRPFTVELVNGERLVSHHPEAVILFGDLAVHVERDFTTHLFDAGCVARIVDVVIPPGAH